MKGELKMCKVIEELFEELREELIREKDIEIAKKMLAKNISIEDIAEITNLPIETIEKLEEEMQLVTV